MPHLLVTVSFLKGLFFFKLYYLLSLSFNVYIILFQVEIWDGEVQQHRSATKSWNIHYQPFASSMGQLQVTLQHGVNLWSCTQQFER